MVQVSARVALDDADEPLILDMQTAEFRVTLQGVE